MSDGRRDMITWQHRCDRCKRPVAGETLYEPGRYNPIQWEGLICLECVEALEKAAEGPSRGEQDR